MRVRCPKSDSHKTFSVTAHVAQEWEVDEDGEFTKVIKDCSDVIHAPDPDDYFVCVTCGAEADVTGEPGYPG